jgi:hypothetical protein
MVSFANPEQAELAFSCADSVALDNGAFPIFTAGPEWIFRLNRDAT